MLHILFFEDFDQNHIAKKRNNKVKITLIGIKPDRFCAMSVSEEVKILNVSCIAPNVRNIKIIENILHLFI